MIRKVSQFRDELADREAIRDCIYLYCRAVDTQDETLLHQVYWPGATDDHVEFRGPAADYVTWSMPRYRVMDYIKHMIANIVIRLNGAEADVESYYQAISGVTHAGGAKVNVVSLGTYRDRFERRNDEWRIAERLVVLTPARPASTALSFGWFANVSALSQPQ